MIKKSKILLLLAVLLGQLVLANVEVNALFSDHMVVQRETEIPIWGWADPLEEIVIEASWGEKTQTIATKNGSWKALLKTPKAGGPFSIKISGNNTILINDVLSGEVWLCTGQSNMDFALEKFLKDARDPKHQPLVEYVRKEVATANEDWIRHIEVPQTTSLDKKKVNFEGEWKSAVPGQITKITATGYFFAKELRKELNIPVGLLECSWGGTKIQPWISEKAYLEDKNLKEYYIANKKEVNNLIGLMDSEDYVDSVYVRKVANWKKNGSKGRKPRKQEHPKRDRQTATTLYNGMLSAVIPYAIKGAIWYQGESNAAYMPNEYKQFLATMISSWRKDWGQGDFPFYWAQLAACNRGDDEADKGWATVNDQLRKSLELPNTGMAVLYDIGEPKDIHPHNKMDVGKRLSLWALKKTYQKEIKVHSGPLYVSSKVIGNKMHIEFSEVGTGLMVGHKNLQENTVKVNDALKWFEILGADGIWKSAQAKIISKNTIEIWEASVTKPIAVRYAWSGNPEGANLYNKEGLPASVFTTLE